METIAFPLLIPDLEVAKDFFKILEIFEIEDLSLKNFNRRAQVSFIKSGLRFCIDMNEPYTEEEQSTLKEQLKSNKLYFMLDIENFFEWHEKMVSKNAPISDLHELPYYISVAITTPFGGFIRIGNLK